MRFFNFLENLFTGFRPYNFVLKRLRARPHRQNNSLSQDRPQRRFMSKHRYTHTTKKWGIGNMHTNSSKHEIK